MDVAMIQPPTPPRPQPSEVRLEGRMKIRPQVRVVAREEPRPRANDIPMGLVLAWVAALIVTTEMLMAFRGFFE
jgi:hypothetical protein